MHPSPTRAGSDEETAVLAHLADLTGRVEKHLRRLYPALASEDAAASLLRADSSWHTLSPSVRTDVAERLHAGMVAPLRWLTDRGGQRWRPGLMLHTMDVLGADERLGLLAAAVELAHAGSLVVDDIEDRSPVRRGHSAVHERYGLPAALNAGTAAYLALSTAVARCLPERDGRRGEIVTTPPRERGGFSSSWLSLATGQPGPQNVGSPHDVGVRAVAAVGAVEL
ncbi:polyprenyl synthetase family protein, partial [Streptomyces sp. CRN 30]|uniref:polyprenyl synthetase family protein n=1 Tax=Streptomyces sp. CRN 30 TaxID=3075613 RepID=UPI002A7FDAEA